MRRELHAQLPVPQHLTAQWQTTLPERVGQAVGVIGVEAESAAAWIEFPTVDTVRSHQPRTGFTPTARTGILGAEEECDAIA